MILEALCEYYDRKAALGEMPARGMESKSIPYLIVINSQGKFIKLECTIEGSGKDQIVKRFLLPCTRTRSGQKSWTIANRLWDHYGYVLGLPKNLKYDGAVCENMGRNQQHIFIEEVGRIYNLNPDNIGVKAIHLFYEHFAENFIWLKRDPLFDDCVKKTGTNLTFILLGNNVPIASDPVINYGDSTEKPFMGLCLVTGQNLPIAVLNNPISLAYANTSGAKLVGFQRNSGYDSYHKEQGMNAPISEEANFKYTTALNTLLGKTSQNRFLLGKDTLVFWASKLHPLENEFSFFFTSPPKDDPDKNGQVIENLMKAPLSGAVNDDNDTQFFVLLLSPNIARIAVRLWEELTVKTLGVNIRQYFTDLDIVRSKEDKRYYSLYTLLASIALQNKIENLPPVLFNDMLRAAIRGLPLPQLLLQQCLLRIKADCVVNSKRAGLLKAYLNRKNRTLNNNINKPITMALDNENQNQAYLLGRLFAVLERIQKEANGKATLRDQFYGAASRTPAVVFPRMMDLSVHHLSKLADRQRIYFEKLKGEIINCLSADGLPPHLSLDDQSRFAIGYYHQRQNFFTQKEENNSNE